MYTGLRWQCVGLSPICFQLLPIFLSCTTVFSIGEKHNRHIMYTSLRWQCVGFSPICFHPYSFPAIQILAYLIFAVPIYLREIVDYLVSFGSHRSQMYRLLSSIVGIGMAAILETSHLLLVGWIWSRSQTLSSSARIMELSDAKNLNNSQCG